MTFRFKLSRAFQVCSVGLFAFVAIALQGCSDDADESAAAADKTILVAGASGRSGSYIINELRQEGRTIRSMTRSAAGAVERLGADFEDMNWIEGDAKDADRMMEIMDGVDLVISVIGSREREGPNGPEFVDWEGVRNLVDAAVAANVEHFVLLTALGASDPDHPLNKALGDALKWRFKGEEYLRASGLAYTIVRPVGLVHDPAPDKGIYIAQGDKWRDMARGTIYYGDLAAILIGAVGNPDAFNKTIEVANREGIVPGTWNVTYPDLVTDAELAAE